MDEKVKTDTVCDQSKRPLQVRGHADTDCLLGRRTTTVGGRSQVKMDYFVAVANIRCENITSSRHMYSKASFGR